MGDGCARRHESMNAPSCSCRLASPRLPMSLSITNNRRPPTPLALLTSSHPSHIPVHAPGSTLLPNARRDAVGKTTTECLAALGAPWQAVVGVDDTALTSLRRSLLTRLARRMVRQIQDSAVLARWALHSPLRARRETSVQQNGPRFQDAPAAASLGLQGEGHEHSLADHNSTFQDEEPARWGSVNRLVDAHRNPHRRSICPGQSKQSGACATPNHHKHRSSAGQVQFKAKLNRRPHAHVQGAKNRCPPQIAWQDISRISK